MKELVSFDLDGTLRESLFDRSNSHAFDQQYFGDILGGPVDKEAIRDAWRKMSNDERDAYKRADYERYMEESRIPSRMIDFVQRVARESRVIIISVATKKWVADNLEKWSFENMFERVYSMKDDYGMSVKTPEVFADVSLDLEVHPRDCVHIGDNYAMDVVPAQKAGWDALLLSHAPVRVYSLDDLKDLDVTS